MHMMNIMTNLHACNRNTYGKNYVEPEPQESLFALMWEASNPEIFPFQTIIFYVVLKRQQNIIKNATRPDKARQDNTCSIDSVICLFSVMPCVPDA
jgi:hypothetical protein